MGKTKNVSVRWDEDELKLLLDTYPELNTSQKTADFLLQYWYSRNKDIGGYEDMEEQFKSTFSNAPSVYDKLPDRLKRRLKK